MLKKILGINLLVFVAYAVFININSSMADKGFNIAIGMGVCIVIQVALNMVTAIACLIMGKKDPGRSLLISAAALVPIGFCTWLILLSIFG
jgi:hypothetical protein